MTVMKERWSWRTNPMRFVVMVVVAALLGTLLGVISAAVVERAYGTCVTSSGEACGTIQPRSRTIARKYRHHKIRHAHGFNPHALFKRPKVAKRIIVRKMMRAAAKAQVNGKPIAVNTARRTTSCYAEDAACWRRVYDGMVEDAGCRSMADLDYAFYWSICSEKMGFKSGTLTKHQIQVGLTVALCGAGVIAYVATSTATGGTTAVIGSTMASSCLVQVWRDIDP